jgi:hypothetical protein
MNPEKSVSNNLPEEVERFNIIFRIQHIIMFTTFLLLSFTGWGLKYGWCRNGGDHSQNSRRWHAP